MYLHQVVIWFVCYSKANESIYLKRYFEKKVCVTKPSNKMSLYLQIMCLDYKFWHSQNIK